MTANARCFSLRVRIQALRLPGQFSALAGGRILNPVGSLERPISREALVQLG